MDPHRRAELRSLAYHRVIAERLRQDSGVLARARARVEGWLATAAPPAEASAWAALLCRDPEDIARLIVEDSESARALRQSTPFAGVLAPAERWHIWRATGGQGEVPP